MSKTIILIIGLIFLSGCIAEEQQKQIETPRPTKTEEVRPIEINITPTATETPYPKPNYIPAITEYFTMVKNNIQLPINPTEYITPNNIWVKYYASQLYVDEDGTVKYKNRSIPWAVDRNGTVLLWTDEVFRNNYSSDEEQFGKADYWVTPEYYLTHEMKDDCEGWATTLVSIFLSGELSIKDNNTFVKQKIPAKVVIGYSGGSRDAWVEYSVYNKLFFSVSGLTQEGFEGKVSYTEFIEKKESGRTLVPVFELTNRDFNEYK